MPQPLSRVQPDAGIIIANAGTPCLSLRPHLAILAMEAINSWSNVESFLLHLYVQLCGGDSSLASKIYLSLEIQTAKTQAIMAAVSSLANQDYQNLIRAIIKIAGTNKKSRDKLAHHVWGYSTHENLSDALLLADPKALLDGRNVDRGEIFVYRENDFRSIIAANDRLCGYGLKIRFILSGHVANRDGHIYVELCNENEIRERLDPRA